MAVKLAFLLIFSIAVVERILFTFRRRKYSGKSRYVWTTYALVSSYVLCVFLSVAYFGFVLDDINIRIAVLGFVLACLGVLLRRKAINALADCWSIHVILFAHHRLVLSSPYHMMRHPYYVAVLLELAGVILFFNAFPVLLFLFFVHLPLLFIRAYLEERVLTHYFGESYKRFR